MYENFVTNFVTKNKNLSPFWRQNGQYRRRPGKWVLTRRKADWYIWIEKIKQKRRGATQI